MKQIDKIFARTRQIKRPFRINSEMKNKVDWLNHSLEFFVVLVGILIAFQLNKYSENKSKNELIENHLENIDLECQENIEILNRSIFHVIEQIKHCDSILSQISFRRDIMAIRSYSTKLLDMRNVELKRNAYEVLIQSGDIRFLDDMSKKEG